MSKLHVYGQEVSPTDSLIAAITMLDVKTVEELMKSDFEIEYRYDNEYSYLHKAVRQIDAEPLRRSSSEEKANWHSNPFFRPDAPRRIVEILLESGQFNVNAFTIFCQTALHFAVSKCSCMFIASDDYKYMVTAITELLLKNDANINAKLSDGETPLMMASHNGCSHNVQALLNWRNELGVGVDLNARDENGETALIKAAKYAHVDVVELLLQHGCLDEFHDHRGFSALHAVIYGPGIINNASSEFFALVRVLACDETKTALKRYAAHSWTGRVLCKQWPGNYDIQKTVSMLVTRGQTDINSKDLLGNTALDLALKSKLLINQKTIEILKEYGATTNATHPEYHEIIVQYTDKLGKTPLHRLSAVLPELTLREKVEIFDFNHLLNNSPRKELLVAMTVAKDHRGRTALHYAVMPTDKPLSSVDIILLINVLNLQPTLNEIDNYGRTPLHYCKDEAIYKSLVEQGANEHIKDIDGKTPPVLKRLRDEELYRYPLPRILTEQQIQDKFDCRIIWNKSAYAYRVQFSIKLCDKVQQFMNKVSDGIRKKDPRFECRPVLIGSAEEGTKIGLPDEFDFNFILTKLGSLCEVVPSPEVPSGYVYLKRKYNIPEYWKNFNSFFNSDGFLLTTEIATMFRILYLQVMREPEFWEGEDFFELDPRSEVCMLYSNECRSFEDSYIKHFTHLCSTIQLKLNRPIETRYMFTLISLDIAPCIKLNGWWPEEALSCLSDDIKLGGCHLVFDQPQKKYPWVPFSDPFAKISFSPGEDRIIKECSAVAKAAYMVGKQFLHYCRESKLTYVLKNCLLYCIEALKDKTSNSLLYENIDPTELRDFFQRLILCYRTFYQKDFVPCYMMPSFHLPISGHLKSNHDQVLLNTGLNFCPPALEPLNEQFIREELMRVLSVDRLLNEYKRAGLISESFASLVCSDSEIGSQVSLSSKREGVRRKKANRSKVKRQDFRNTI